MIQASFARLLDEARHLHEALLRRYSLIMAPVAAVDDGAKPFLCRSLCGKLLLCFAKL
jgi:hypothetical protein